MASPTSHADATTPVVKLATPADLVNFLNEFHSTLAAHVHAEYTKAVKGEGQPKEESHKLGAGSGGAAAAIFSPITIAVAGQVAKSIQDATVAYFSDAMLKGIDVSRDAVKQFVSDSTINFLIAAGQHLKG